jgi:hypothetical protein
MARRRLSNFVDAYLKHYLQLKQQEEQSRLIGERQTQLATLNNDSEMLQKVLGDPTGRIAAALNRGGVPSVGRVPINALMQQRNEGLGNVSAAIQGAKTRPELPTQIGVERLVGMQPSLDSRNPLDVEAGISELNQRDQRLKSLTPPMRVDGAYNSLTGAEETKFLPGAPEDLTGQTVITKPDPQQRGLDEASQKVSEYNAPGMPELRQGEVTQAGAKAGAEAKARHPYDIEMERVRQANRLELERRTRAADSAKLGAVAAEKVAGADAALHSAKKMLMLYQTQGSNIPNQIGPVEGRKMTARQVLPILSPVDPRFAEFSAEESTLRNNMIKAITGAQMSDPEARRIMQQLPDRTNKNVDWEARMTATIANLEFLRNRIMELNRGGAAPIDPTVAAEYKVDESGNLVRIR